MDSTPIPAAQEAASLRLFVAVPVPTEVRERLAQAQRHLSAAGVRFRFVRPEGMHLTLVFLGQTAADRVEPLAAQLDAAAALVRPFHLVARGLGCFPTLARPRVLWAGLAGDVSALARLQQDIQRRVVALGLPVEDRAFRPHVTLGRAAGQPPIVSPGALDPGVEFGRWTATAVELIRSELRPGGSLYTTLRRAAFGASGVAPDAPAPARQEA